MSGPLDRFARPCELFFVSDLVLLAFLLLLSLFFSRLSEIVWLGFWFGHTICVL